MDLQFEFSIIPGGLAGRNIVLKKKKTFYVVSALALALIVFKKIC